VTSAITNQSVIIISAQFYFIFYKYILVVSVMAYNYVLITFFMG